MSYEIVREEGSKRTVRFTASAGEVTSLFASIRKRINQELKIPGFRAGHVPRSLIESRFGNLIRTEVAEEMHDRSTDSLLEEKDWILSSREPSHDGALPADGSEYVFEITFDVFELPEPGGYASFEVSVPVFDVEVALSKTLDSIRERMVGFEEVQRPARHGDMLLVEAVRSGASDAPERMALRMGEEGLGPGLDALLEGASAGDTKIARIEMTAPPEGSEAPEPGRPTEFRVMQVREPRLPELDDEIARKAGGYKDLEDMKNSLRERLARRWEKDRAEAVESQVMTALLDRNPLEPPAYMVENLGADLLKEVEGSPDDATKRFAAEVAARKVREFLVLRAVALKEKLDPTPEEIAAEAGDSGSRTSALDRIRNRRALELLLSRAAVTEADPEPAAASQDQGPEPAWAWRACEAAEPEKAERQD
jgi:trigger factor